MVRHVIVVTGAVVLSGLLAAFFSWRLAHSADTQSLMQIMADSQGGEPIDDQRAEAALRVLERNSNRMTWFYCPAVTLVVGIFVGFASRRLAWQLAVIGIAPFAFLLSVGTQGFLRGLGVLAVYLTTAALGAWSTSRLRFRPARC